jgi:Zn-dependent protease with chaperone function
VLNNHAFGNIPIQFRAELLAQLEASHKGPVRTDFLSTRPATPERIQALQADTGPGCP